MKDLDSMVDHRQEMARKPHHHDVAGANLLLTIPQHNEVARCSAGSIDLMTTGCAELLIAHTPFQTMKTAAMAHATGSGSDSKRLRSGTLIGRRHG